MDWLILAIAAMLFIAVANIFLKKLMSLDNPLTLQALPIIIPFAVIGLLGLACFIFATRAPTSKIGVVSAIASLSTVLIAILAAIFLGEKYSAKEIGAIALTAVALLVLVS